MADRVDLNRATRDQLVALPGIGPALADRIVAHRARIVRFDSVDDLVHVSGVSEGLLDRLRPTLTIDSVRSGAAAAAAERATVTITLQAAAGSPDFSGYRIVLEGIQNLPDGESSAPFASSMPTDAGGTAVLGIPVRERLVGDVTIRVQAPDGTVLLSDTRTGPKLPESITLEVVPKEYGQTLPNTAPSAGKPTRVRGRVIDEGGKRVPADVQVVLWGASVANPTDADFRALVVASTDPTGHFAGPYPLGDFSEAHATVAVGDKPATVKIHLEETDFPADVILVVDLPEPAALAECDDCGDVKDPPRAPEAADLARADGTFSSDPGAGRCVDFTKPDRTLEEFTYKYLVRTTEPEIRGLELDEPSKIDVSKILDVLKASDVGRTVRAPTLMMADATGANAEAGRPIESARVDARVLKSLARDPDGFSLTAIIAADQRTRFGDLKRVIGTAIARPPSRSRLSCDVPVDWDDDPTIYQACTIAHGHVLRFKQEWVADGYSMGSLLYSLPLAPGQKKQIAVVDWERREAASRTETIEERERLDASLERDRDINDIVNGTIRESTRGGSSSSGGGIAAGLGVAAVLGPVGGVLGIGGGYSSASSSAWQNSSRDTAANALNQLRDRTVQSASAMRSQRSSVVQTVTQGERVVATTETVANYNHCHAITVQYFEVLRHLLIRQRLVDVQECLFVPLLMSWFTEDKARRWRNTMANAVPRRLQGGFDALDRIANNYAGSDLPLGRYADEPLESVEGELQIRFQLARPRDIDDQFDPAAWSPLLRLFGFNPADFYNQFLKEQQFKDRIFLEQLGPRIATSLVSAMRINALRTDGSSVDLKIDPTLLTRFANDQTLFVTLRMAADLPPIQRGEIKAVVISAQLQLAGLPFTIDVLPAGSRVIVESGSLRYRTAHLSDALFRDSFIRNDLTGSDDVRIPTPLNRQELRNPREEDKELARNLLDHLNENIERYHHLIWARMSPDRRYMLVDGFEAPNSGGKSVASVTENELLGIVGNCLVMPVARGYHLDPTFNQDAEHPVDLLEHYEPNTPIEPSRVAVPTRGVYCEAVMGACNSCEVKDETRFWRWEESPIPDQPPQILPTSTDTRRAEPPNLTAKDFPNAIVAMQSAPAAPDPTGLAAAFNLLGQAGVFRDITGLEGTQRNAAAALEGAFQTATTMGTKAADLALQGKMSKDIDKAIKTIQTAKSQGLITDQQASQLTDTAIRGMVGAGATNPPTSTSTQEVQDITKTAGDNNAAVKMTRPTGEQVEVDARANREDSTKPVIVLSDGTNSAETRAFRPATHDNTGAIEVEATVRNLPSGGTARWSRPDAAGLTIANAASPRTVIQAGRPGRTSLDYSAFDAGGTQVASTKIQIAVPQFVRINEEAAALDPVLAKFHIDDVKAPVFAAAKRVTQQLLRTSNVRTIWNIAGMTETVPSNIVAANLMELTVRGDPPTAGLLGRTNPPGGPTVFNETIDIFPGAYDDAAAPNVEVDLETNALVIQLESAAIVDPALKAFAIEVFGRLFGETIAHEIVHGVLWDQINPPSDHNHPAIPNDLMNQGTDRTFRQRTGFEDTAHTSPVDPAHFVDHGIAAIGGLQATNQTIMNQQFPVPPAFP